MKAKLQHRIFHPGALPRMRKIDLLTLLDKAILPIGTCSFVAGIGAAALGMHPASDYLLAAGVLCFLAFWLPGLAGGGKATNAD